MHVTVHAVLEDAAKTFGDQPLVIASDRTLSFREVDELSRLLARSLRRLHIQPGEPVTLWMENGWRWMVAYFAILKCGAVVNPVNILLTASEVGYVLRDCESRALIAGAEALRTLPDRPSIPIISDGPAPAADFDLDALIDAGRSPAESQMAAQVGPKSVASIGYTSGTTGRPKGAVIRHESIVMNTAMTSLMHGRRRGDVVVSALPCPHVYGNIVMNAAVACGMTLVLLPRFDEEATLRAIQTHRATVFEGVPAMYLRLLNYPRLALFDLASLRLCTVGGQTMPVSKLEEVEQRFKCRLVELWGMTEIGGLGITHPHDGPRKLGSIGIVMPGSEAKVADPADATKTLPHGEAGELLFRGPLVMEGYWGNPAATSEAITSDGWLHTGDIVTQDAEGYFHVVDRKKDVIISGGYKVYPAEVERVIAQHPAVAQVAVAAMLDEVKGQVPKAFIVLRHGARATGTEIIEHCRGELASYKTPRAVEFIADLPKTSTGKTLRRALTETFSTRKT